MVSRVVLLLRMAALVSIASGLIGGAVWLVDLLDRSDGDDLRWGFWHNPFMGFTPFSEAYLEISMWVLLGCSAAVGLGGLLLLARRKLGVHLVAWQAPVSIATNSIIVIYIALMAVGVLAMEWTSEALALRLGSIVVNLVLWKFLKSSVVTEFFAGHSSPVVNLDGQ
ncbi:MAG: hypothetical protein ACI91B_003630 [Planctomycetota bacterium]|jgi:hypothetical protein